MTLRVIDGGGGGSASETTERVFKEHQFATDLWNAIYPKGATSLTVIAARMSKSTGVNISTTTVGAVIGHVRDHAYEYGWTVPPVQKGRFGVHRKYFVALVDPNDPETMISADESTDHLISAQKGAISSAMTIATQGANAGIALEIFSGAAQLSRNEQRLVSAAASMFSAASEMVKNVVTKIKAVG